jgi:hypothetical protein
MAKACRAGQVSSVLPSLVMPGHDPGTHVLPLASSVPRCVDRRVKPGDDEEM